MTSRSLVLFIVATLAAVSVVGHDLFLKLDSYFLATNTKATVQMLNGTFQSSDGIVKRDRMRDISLIAPDAGISSAKSISWRDMEKTTLMEIQTGGPGTYLLGISTKPREIDLKAADLFRYSIITLIPPNGLTARSVSRNTTFLSPKSALISLCTVPSSFKLF